jgi:hypothetical protein
MRPGYVLSETNSSGEPLTHSEEPTPTVTTTVRSRTVPFELHRTERSPMRRVTGKLAAKEIDTALHG